MVLANGFPKIYLCWQLLYKLESCFISPYSFEVMIHRVSCVRFSEEISDNVCRVILQPPDGFLYRRSMLKFWFMRLLMFHSNESLAYISSPFPSHKHLVLTVFPVGVRRLFCPWSNLLYQRTDNCQVWAVFFIKTRETFISCEWWDICP